MLLFFAWVAPFFYSLTVFFIDFILQLAKYTTTEVKSMSIKPCIICNSYTTAVRDLPDIYTQSPRAAGLRAEGVCYRQIPNCHSINDIFHFKSYSGALYWALYNKEAWLHERRAATMLTRIIHNISGQYRHKLIKQRNLHVVIHNIAEQTLLLLFRLEMQTHNRSVRLSISVILPGVLLVRLQSW